MSSTPVTPNFDDQAAPLLQKADGIDDSQRDELWHVFHESKDENELARQLEPMAVPSPLKTKLWQAKRERHPAVVSPVDKGMDIITKLGGIDVAEQHPNVTKALLTLAAKEADAATPAAQEEGSAKGKGKQAKNPQTEPQTAPPPRPDGLPPLPSIPDGHYRILTSDGGIHDIPADKIEEARQRDPLLHVLNP